MRRVEGDTDERVDCGWYGAGRDWKGSELFKSVRFAIPAPSALERSSLMDDRLNESGTCSSDLEGVVVLS